MVCLKHEFGGIGIMATRRFWVMAAALIGAVAVGAGLAIASVEINRITSTDAFCSTSCHSMTFVADDTRFAHSAHRSGERGVIASCADCHIPRTNWFVETYVHVTKGIKDIWVETTSGPIDAAAWEAKRADLAHAVRNEMREADSVTCRSCHDADKVQPPGAAGKAAHALMLTGAKTCIDCHFNLVHAPVPPRPDFLRGSWANAK